MTTITITITWGAFADSLTIGEEVASATIVTDIKSLGLDIADDMDIADEVFHGTNTYQGALWDLLEPVLPAKRTHTALSINDYVTVNGNTYRCAYAGWEKVSSDNNINA